jgi:hypothetical protein
MRGFQAILPSRLREGTEGRGCSCPLAQPLPLTPSRKRERGL